MMRKLRLLLFLIAVLSITSCKNYSDGTYCADIDYYNPNTGTRNTYSLNVEVENNAVTVIHWPNGGWLDDSHFTAEELDGDGYCSFTSNEGYEYNIQITGTECSFTDEADAQSDSEDDQAAVTCPECGGDKEANDDLCWDCERKAKREKEDIEEHTCKRCGQHDSFMFSTDELCSDCERDDEDRKRQEEEDEN